MTPSPNMDLAGLLDRAGNDEAVLEICRVVHPHIFARGLDPLPGDGPATRARIAETRLLAERILTALPSLKAST